jgi:tRNA (mo5U34)-methyltransferase
MTPGASGPAGREAALRRRADELTSVYWHHSIRLFPDLVTRGAKSPDFLSAECERVLGPLDLRGRSVLDVGTWNGHYAFEAARRGAAAVTASDSYCWREPAFRGRETFDLARSCLGLDNSVQAVEIDPVDLPGPLQPFDVVLFLGVFYHLYDPIDVLGKVARLARHALVVETHQDLLGLGRPAMAFYPRDELNGDASNWWGPNPECVLELLASQGFEAALHRKHPIVEGRGIYHAFRTHEAARELLRTASDRAALQDLRSEGRQATAAGGDPGGHTLAAALAECDALRAERDRMLASTSWRLTRPLRLLAGALRRRR